MGDADPNDNDLHNRSTNTLSRQAPRPSMLIWIRFFCRAWMKLEAVNCDPWSVLKPSGGPYFVIASSSPSTQKSAVMLSETRQLRTLRLYQPMTATRYTKP